MAMKAAVVLSEQEDIARTVVSRMTLKSQVPAGCASTFDVLVVSGGGDYGAFGAGVLTPDAQIDRRALGLSHGR